MSSKGMFIHGSFSFENQYIPTKALRAECRALDESGYAAWIKETAQSKTDRVLLELVGKEIEYVSGPVFEKSLEGCIKGFKKKIDSGYVVLVEPGKSQTWATALALEKGLKPGCALRLGEEGSNMLGYSLEGLSSKIRRKVGKTNNIVIVDDGSFTGNQMANNISGASRILEKVYGHKKHEFHVIVPFVTEPAAKKLFGLKQKVHLYTSPRTMKSVAEVIPAKYLDRGLELLGVHKSRASSAALTYFSHKIPNSMSFPRALAEGGFIPDFPPPYKGVQVKEEAKRSG